MRHFIGFQEAFDLTISSVPKTGTQTLPLPISSGRVLSEDVVSRVDCPSADSSLKDGYAVVSEDLEGASQDKTVRLKVVGRSVAGKAPSLVLGPGQAAEITTGAPVPSGAGAVLSKEFCHREKDQILCFNTAGHGQNIYHRGSDIRCGERVATSGEILSPALLGLIASAGLEEVPVFKSPSVAVIATGDEVVAPGAPLSEGKLYASNMVEICAWLSLYGLSFETALVVDRQKEIESAILRFLPHVDAFLTSGGAWGSERDLMMRVLNALGWQGIYHRVRMGPGKAVGFGLLEKKPFFCLPGGPPSNEMALLQLALPGLLAMENYHRPLFPTALAQLSETVRGDREWTQFIHARVEKRGHALSVRPSRSARRLQSMARKEALIVIPEGAHELRKGQEIEVQLVGTHGARTPTPRFGEKPGK